MVSQDKKVLLIIACLILAVSALYSFLPMIKDITENESIHSYSGYELNLYEDGNPVSYGENVYFIEEDTGNPKEYLINICNRSCDTQLDIFGNTIKIYKANQSVYNFYNFKNKAKDDWYLNTPGCEGFVTKREELDQIINYDPSPCYPINLKLQNAAYSDEKKVLFRKELTKCVVDNGFEFYDNPKCIIADEDMEQIAKAKYKDYVDELKSTAKNIYEVPIPESLRESGATILNIDLNTKKATVPENEQLGHSVYVLKVAFEFFILKLLTLLFVILVSKNSVPKIKKYAYILLISATAFISAPSFYRAFDDFFQLFTSGTPFPAFLAQLILLIIVPDILLLMPLFDFSFKKSSVMALVINILPALAFILSTILFFRNIL